MGLVRLFIVLLGISYATSLRQVCYYTNWSAARPNGGHFTPADIDPNLCTHIIFAYARIVGERIVPTGLNDETTPSAVGFYERVTSLKNINPELKVLLGVNGWNTRYHPDHSLGLVASPNFVQTTIDYLRRWEFDGVDLDWEYSSRRRGLPTSKDGFSELLRELSSGFEAEAIRTGKPRLLLSAAVTARKADINKRYDVPSLSRYLDFLNVMSYDFHGPWKATLGHSSPLKARKDQLGDSAHLNTVAAINYWLRLGADPKKLVVGIPFYGRTYTVMRPNMTEIGDQDVGIGPAGPFTHENGFMAFYEICELLRSGATRVWHPEHMAPYLIHNNTWVSYDDPESVQKKANWIRREGLGGAMIWSLDLDDFSGRFCGGGRYPLLSKIDSEFKTFESTRTSSVSEPDASRLFGAWRALASGTGTDFQTGFSDGSQSVAGSSLLTKGGGLTLTAGGNDMNSVGMGTDIETGMSREGGTQKFGEVRITGSTIRKDMNVNAVESTGAIQGDGQGNIRTGMQTNTQQLGILGSGPTIPSQDVRLTAGRGIQADMGTGFEGVSGTDFKAGTISDGQAVLGSERQLTIGIDGQDRGGIDVGGSKVSGTSLVFKQDANFNRLGHQQATPERTRSATAATGLNTLSLREGLDLRLGSSGQTSDGLRIQTGSAGVDFQGAGTGVGLSADEVLSAGGAIRADRKKSSEAGTSRVHTNVAASTGVIHDVGQDAFQAGIQPDTHTAGFIGDFTISGQDVPLTDGRQARLEIEKGHLGVSRTGVQAGTSGEVHISGFEAGISGDGQIRKDSTTQVGVSMDGKQRGRPDIGGGSVSGSTFGFERVAISQGGDHLSGERASQAGTISEGMMKKDIQGVGVGTSREAFHAQLTPTGELLMETGSAGIDMLGPASGLDSTGPVGNQFLGQRASQEGTFSAGVMSKDIQGVGIGTNLQTETSREAFNAQLTPSGELQIKTGSAGIELQGPASGIDLTGPGDMSSGGAAIRKDMHTLVVGQTGDTRKDGVGEFQAGMATDMRRGGFEGNFKVSGHGISSTDFQASTVGDGTGIRATDSVVDFSARRPGLQTGSEAVMNGGVIRKEMHTAVLDQPATITKVGERDFHAGMATDMRGTGFAGDVKVSGGESLGATFQTGIIGESQTGLSGDRTAPGSSFGFERVVVSHSDGQIGGLRDGHAGTLGGDTVFQMGSTEKNIQGTDSHIGLSGQKAIRAGMITSGETGMTGAAVKQEINTFVANQPSDIKSVGQGDFQAGMRTDKTSSSFTRPAGFDIQGTSSGVDFIGTEAIRSDKMSSGDFGVSGGDIRTDVVGDQTGIVKEAGQSGFMAGMTTDTRSRDAAGDFQIFGRDVSGTDLQRSMTGDIQPGISRGTAQGSGFGFEGAVTSHTGDQFGGQIPSQDGTLSAGVISKNIQGIHEGTGSQAGTSSLAFQTQLTSTGEQQVGPGSSGTNILSTGSAVDFTGTGVRSTAIKTGAEAGTTGTAVRKDMPAFAIDQPGNINEVGEAGMIADMRGSGFASDFKISGQGDSGTGFETGLAGDRMGMIGTASGMESSATGQIRGDMQSGSLNRMSGVGIQKVMDTFEADQSRVVKKAEEERVQAALTTDAGADAVPGGFKISGQGAFATDFRTGMTGDFIGIRDTGPGVEFSATGDIRGDIKTSGEKGMSGVALRKEMQTFVMDQPNVVKKAGQADFQAGTIADMSGGAFASDFKTSDQGASRTDFQTGLTGDVIGIRSTGSGVDFSVTGDIRGGTKINGETGKGGTAIRKETQTFAADQTGILKKTGQGDFQTNILSDTRGVDFAGDFKISGNEAIGTGFQAGNIDFKQTGTSAGALPGSSFGFERVVISHSGDGGGQMPNQEGAGRKDIHGLAQMTGLQTGTSRVPFQTQMTQSGELRAETGTAGIGLQDSGSFLGSTGPKDFGTDIATGSEPGMIAASVSQEMHAFGIDQPGVAKKAGQHDSQDGMAIDTRGSSFAGDFKISGQGVFGTKTGMAGDVIGFSSTGSGVDRTTGDVRVDMGTSGETGMKLSAIRKDPQTIVVDQTGNLNKIAGTVLQSDTATDTTGDGFAGVFKQTGHGASRTDLHSGMTVGGQRSGTPLRKEIETSVVDQLGDVKSSGKADFHSDLIGDMSTDLTPGRSFGFERVVMSHGGDQLGGQMTSKEEGLSAGVIRKVAGAGLDTGLSTDTRGGAFVKQDVGAGTGFQIRTKGEAFQTNLTPTGQMRIETGSVGIGIQGTNSGVDFTGPRDTRNDIKASAETGMTGSATRKEMHTVVIDQPGAVRNVGQGDFQSGMTADTRSSGFAGEFKISSQGVSGTDLTSTDTRRESLGVDFGSTGDIRQMSDAKVQSDAASSFSGSQSAALAAQRQMFDLGLDAGTQQRDFSGTPTELKVVQPSSSVSGTFQFRKDSSSGAASNLLSDTRTSSGILADMGISSKATFLRDSSTKVDAQPMVRTTLQTEVQPQFAFDTHGGRSSTGTLFSQGKSAVSGQREEISANIIHHRPLVSSLFSWSGTAPEIIEEHVEGNLLLDSLSSRPSGQNTKLGMKTDSTFKDFTIQSHEIGSAAEPLTGARQHQTNRMDSQFHAETPTIGTGSVRRNEMAAGVDFQIDTGDTQSFKPHVVKTTSRISTFPQDATNRQKGPITGMMFHSGRLNVDGKGVQQLGTETGLAANMQSGGMARESSGVEQTGTGAVGITFDSQPGPTSSGFHTEEMRVIKSQGIVGGGIRDDMARESSGTQQTGTGVVGITFDSQPGPTSSGFHTEEMRVIKSQGIIDGRIRDDMARESSGTQQTGTGVVGITFDSQPGPTSSGFHSGGMRVIKSQGIVGGGIRDDMARESSGTQQTGTGVVGITFDSQPGPTSSGFHTGEMRVIKSQGIVGGRIRDDMARESSGSQQTGTGVVGITFDSQPGPTSSGFHTGEMRVIKSQEIVGGGIRDDMARESSGSQQTGTGVVDITFDSQPMFDSSGVQTGEMRVMKTQGTFGDGMRNVKPHLMTTDVKTDSRLGPQVGNTGTQGKFASSVVTWKSKSQNPSQMSSGTDSKQLMSALNKQMDKMRADLLAKHRQNLGSSTHVQFGTLAGTSGGPVIHTLNGPSLDAATGPVQLEGRTFTLTNPHTGGEIRVQGTGPAVQVGQSGTHASKQMVDQSSLLRGSNSAGDMTLTLVGTESGSAQSLSGGQLSGTGPAVQTGQSGQMVGHSSLSTGAGSTGDMKVTLVGAERRLGGQVSGTGPVVRTWTSRIHKPGQAVGQSNFLTNGGSAGDKNVNFVLSSAGQAGGLVREGGSGQVIQFGQSGMHKSNPAVDHSSLLTGGGSAADMKVTVVGTEAGSADGKSGGQRHVVGSGPATQIGQSGIDKSGQLVGHSDLPTGGGSMGEMEIRMVGTGTGSADGQSGSQLHVFGTGPVIQTGPSGIHKSGQVVGHSSLRTEGGETGDMKVTMVGTGTGSAGGQPGRQMTDSASGQQHFFRMSQGTSGSWNNHGMDPIVILQPFSQSAGMNNQVMGFNGGRNAAAQNFLSMNMREFIGNPNLNRVRINQQQRENIKTNSISTQKIKMTNPVKISGAMGSNLIDGTQGVRSRVATTETSQNNLAGTGQANTLSSKTVPGSVKCKPGSLLCFNHINKVIVRANDRNNKVGVWTKPTSDKAGATNVRPLTNV